MSHKPSHSRFGKLTFGRTGKFVHFICQAKNAIVNNSRCYYHETLIPAFIVTVYKVRNTKIPTLPTLFVPRKLDLTFLPSIPLKTPEIVRLQSYLKLLIILLDFMPKSIDEPNIPSIIF